MRSRLEDLVARPRPAWPEGAAAHVATCGACAQALAAERLARGLVVTAARAAESSPGFARRVMAAVGDGGRRVEEGDLWRPAWTLLPAFGSVAAALLVLLLQSPNPLPVATAWPGLIPPASTAESLVFEAGTSNPDLLLAAVLENGR